MMKVIKYKSQQLIFSPTLCYPNLFELESFKIEVQALKKVRNESSFFNILNKLFEFYCNKFSPNFNYQPISDCLKNLWENEYNLVINIQPLIDLLELPTDTQLPTYTYMQIFIHCIIAARSQTITFDKKVTIDTKEKAFAYKEKTQKRFHFMKSIVDSLEKLFFSTISDEARSSFLKGIFSDVSAQLENISYSLFFQTYITHHRELILYGNDAIKTKTSFFKKLAPYIKNRQYEFSDGFFSFLFETNSFWDIDCAKYYYAIGNDTLADSYLKDLDLEGLLKDQGNVKKEVTKVKSILNKYPKIKIYTSLLKCLIYLIYTKDIAPKSVSIQELLNIFTPESTLKELLGLLPKSSLKEALSILQPESTLKELLDILKPESALKEALDILKPESALKELKKYNEVSNESSMSIKKALTVLSLSYENNYNNDLNQTRICIDIIVKLGAIFKKDSTYVMSTYIRSVLFVYGTKMATAEQNIRKTLSDKNLNTNLVEAQKKIAELEAEKLKLTENEPNQYHVNEEHDYLKKQQETIQKLKAQIETIKQKDLALTQISVEEQSVLEVLKESLKKENTKLRQENALLKEEVKKIQDSLDEPRQQETTLKSSIEKLKETKKNLEKEIQALQTQLYELPQKIINLKKQKEILLQKKKIKSLRKKIKKLQSIQIKTEESLEAAHQETLAVNEANEESNLAWANHLYEFNCILNMLNYIAESKHAVVPTVFYAPANPVTPKMTLQTSKHSNPFARSKKQKIHLGR